MSHSYVSGRVKAALKKARGDTARAQRLLLEWAREDELLLRGLTAPHLRGIVAHAVMHETGGPLHSVKAAPLPPEQAPPPPPARPVSQKAAPAPKPGGKTISRADIAAAEGTIGAELLKSLGADGGEEFGVVGFGGRSSKSRHAPAGKTSDRHQRAIKALVEGKSTSHKD